MSRSRKIRLCGVSFDILDRIPQKSGMPYTFKVDFCYYLLGLGRKEYSGDNPPRIQVITSREDRGQCLFTQDDLVQISSSATDCEVSCDPKWGIKLIKFSGNCSEDPAKDNGDTIRDAKSRAEQWLRNSGQKYQLSIVVFFNENYHECNECQQWTLPHKFMNIPPP